MNVHLLNYNNKLNRKVKGYDNYNSYVPYIISSSNEINKSPKDSLNNVFIYNDTADELSGKGRPDYCLLCDDKNNIKSRWFVISCLHKGSNGTYSQYEITIERDIWYDFHETLKESTILCRRGYAPVDSPLILNLDTEEFPMNKIKYKEVLLKEEGVDVPYLYLYRTKATSELSINLNFDFNGLDDNEVNDMVDKAIKEYLFGLPFASYYKVFEPGSNDIYLEDTSTEEKMKNFTKEQLEQLKKAYNITDVAIGPEGFMTGLIGRSGNYFELDNSTLTVVEETKTSINLSKISDANIISFINSHSNVAFKYTPFPIKIMPLNGSLTLSTVGLNKMHTDDCAFDIYCLPFTVDNLALLSGLISDGASYDWQILPYRPDTDEELTTYNSATIILSVDGITYNQRIKVCKKATRKFRIFTPDEFNQGETIGGLTELEPYNLVTTSYREAKKGMNAYEVRLVSPDTQATEIINPYFNYDGTGLHLINAFDIYMKLQPFSPYIQVKPVYKGYNGINVDDYRGLICGSGFSLAMANDQWASYQLNNKNYQQQFDREVQTQKLNIGINAVNGITKTVSQGISGFAMGGVAGAAIGAGAGLVDTATQLGAGIYNLDTAKKEFRWNIENIQNRARVLKNIDAQNPNFKFFPYLEVFKATDEEIERYSMFLMKHGSRINAEGTFKDFIDTDNGTYNYIEGTIDEYEGNDMDAMMLAKASDELNQGIYYEVSEDD